MNYQEIDLFIIKQIFDSHKKKEEITTWKIAGKFFSQFKELSDIEKRNKCNTVIRRLRLMEKEGLVFISKNGRKSRYELISDNIKFKKIKFPYGKISDCVFLREKNCNWKIFQI